ncbi:unnamed protein product [Strongylus vulgaris]|uniref:Glycosyltransferase 2-like domain-containing protein n=1 Tax=Strongylus vulgaris TaxID=40348 RepID=A0A3P7K1T4_STRVU|nr:unnamed protein product [Strongylus vulgaris]
MRMARAGVLRAVVVTSIVWLLLDVVVLFYYLDTGSITSGKRSAVRGDRIEFSKSTLSVTGDAEEKEVINVPHAKRLFGNKTTIGSHVQQQLDILLMKSFQKPEHGEQGVAVAVPAEKTAEKDKRFLENQFNVMASEMISVNRSLPDYRSAECQAQVYQKENLPKTSIIIVFHNEAWTTLLRTLHSVINRYMLIFSKSLKPSRF